VADIEAMPIGPPYVNAVGCQPPSIGFPAFFADLETPARFLAIAPDRVTTVRLTFGHSTRDLHAVATNLFALAHPPRIPPNFSAGELGTLSAAKRAAATLLPEQVAWIGRHDKTIASVVRPERLADLLAQEAYYGALALALALALT
jgi:hypothetical protein